MLNKVKLSMKKWWSVWILVVLGLIGYGLVSILRIDNKIFEDEVILVVPTITNEIIRVAIMADIHNDGEQLSKMLSLARTNGVDMVIMAGDLTNWGSKEELEKIKNILEKSTLKYAVVPGDHEKNLSDFRSIFGVNYQSIGLGGVKFILIDNGSWHGLGEVQKKWVETEVTDCRELVCIGIMHKALNNLWSAQVMGENNKKVEAEADWLRELLIKAGVKQIEVGDLHYAGSYELEGIRTDVVGAISREDNNQSPRYTELVISNGLIERRVVEEEN